MTENVRPVSRVVRVCKNEIEYSVVRKPVKNINIRVHPDRSVRVSAGPRVPDRVLDSFVAQKAGWILKCFEKFDCQNMIREPTFADGDTVRILGREYVFKALFSKREEVRIDSRESRILLMTKDPIDAARKKRLYEKWISEQCEKVFGVIVAQSLPLFKGYKVPVPELKIRKMRARWGSCIAARKRITLNKMLIAAPRPAIEYVVVHELAHFVHQNHSKEFYGLVRSILPDYKERKKMLKQ
jgi:predicted metal-dependent hydrolase